MKSHLIVLVLLLSSIIPMSAQTRLGTVPWDVHYSALDSLLFGDGYIDDETVITMNPWTDSVLCLKCIFGLNPKNSELRYLVYNWKSRDITTYRCQSPDGIIVEVSLELSRLINNAVYSSAPGNYGIGIDTPRIYFYSWEHSAMCNWPPKQDGDNCDRLARLIAKVEKAVQENDLESIEKLRPEIRSLTEVFEELRAAVKD